MKRGAGRIFLAILKGGGGHIKFWGKVLLEVLTILEGGHKRFPPFKRGGGRKKFDPGQRPYIRETMHSALNL